MTARPAAKHLFTRFYAANPELLHAAAHSHHPWPDVSFVTPRAGDVFAALAKRDVVVDYRRDRLRIGFGIYHDEADVERLAGIVTDVWPRVP
ncbi:hypothetical protein BH20ACT4_BH20ACT4_09140 [soil metagenome]